VSSIVDSCQGLIETKKSIIYPLIDRLIRLILSLSISITTIKQILSATKIVRTKLPNRMEDDFLANYLIVYIEKKINEILKIKMIINYFYSMKEQ